MNLHNNKRPGLAASGGGTALPSNGWSLDTAFKTFRESRQAQSVASSTLDHYDKSWKLFLKYAARHDLLGINDVQSRHMNGFFVALDCGKESPIQKRGGGPYAATNKHNIGIDLKAMFNWLATQKENKKPVLDENPFGGASVPAAPDLILPPYTDEELGKLVKACEGSEPLRIRDKALLFFLLDSATRREECHDLRIRDLNMDRGEVTILDGKGGTTRTAVFENVTARSIQRYLNLGAIAELDGDEPLWWGKYGPLTYEGLGEVIENIGERAEVNGSCHKLRRTAAIKMLRNGASIEDVRRLLGHKDYQVIRKYLAYVTEDLKRAHSKHSPVNSLECVQPKKKGIAKKRQKQKPSGIGRAAA
jgi:integrase/recombinase XerC